VEIFCSHEIKEKTGEFKKRKKEKPQSKNSLVGLTRLLTEFPNLYLVMSIQTLVLMTNILIGYGSLI